MRTENKLQSIECRDCGTYFNTFDPLQIICEDCIDVRMDDEASDAESQQYQDEGEATSHLNGAWA